MYVRMCVHACLCIYACECIQACMHICVYMCANKGACACVCVCVCAGAWEQQLQVRNLPWVTYYQKFMLIKVLHSPGIL